LICEAYQPAILTTAVMAAFNPRPDVRSWEWINEHGRTHKGEPFDGDRIPWCEGVCDAWDDPATREISLEWGTRTGKTTIALQLMASTAVLKPMPGLFATSTQTLAKKTVRRKIYPMLESIEATRRQLPAPRFRALEEIRLSSSPWGVAWSGSETQLADVEAYYGWANEIDKWSMNERQAGDAGEGDPVDQWEERFKENPDHKKLFECSPSTKLRSRIHRRVLASNNCRYWVGCPKCRQRQVLKLGTDSQSLGGILFDRAADGSVEASVARATARYVCEHCRHEIHDDQRPRMMRTGKWAPEGCRVDIRGRVIGKPKRDSTIWGGQLSSLYSLQLRWGDIAARFVQTIGQPQSLRMFVNGWLAETWEPHKSKNEPEEVGDRLATSTPAGVMPVWSTWLFAAVDIQGDHYVYWVNAVGPGEREHEVAHGTCETLDEIEQLVICRQFEHEDGGEPLCPALTLIDSGFRTRDVYVFCQKFRGTPYNVMPCKGSNTDCGGEAYEVKIIGLNEGKSVRTKKALMRAGRGLRRIRVNPHYYEPIIQEQLDERQPGEPGSLTLNSESKGDDDFLRQLCNGAESAEPSKTDPNRHLWVKRWEGEPNDYRDGKKYARCAADVRFKSNWKLAEKRQPSGKAAPRPVAVQAAEPEGGRRRERFKPEFRRGRRRA
jgi:phage terminase large subunit GpA-like protein